MFIIQTLTFCSISGTVSRYNFKLPLSKTPDLTSELSFRKNKKMIYYKMAF